MSATVDDFVRKRVRPEFQEIVAALRAMMREYAPDVREEMSYGILAFRGRLILAVISPTKKGITFALSRGAEFEDKYGLLEGVGKVSKNVRLRDVKEINRAAMRYYIRQAVKLDKAGRK